MKWNPSVLLLASAIAVAGCSNQDDPHPTETRQAVKAAAVVAVPATYKYSTVYRRVDLSFSPIPIDTELAAVRPDLAEIKIEGCDKENDCEWFDAAKVRHYFFPVDIGSKSSPHTDGLVVKIVRASDFEGRSISALGIGTARQKDEVLANVRKFLPSVTLDCSQPASGNVGPDECDASVDPGWFQIGFDKQGMLEAVRFDAYQFV